MTRARYTHGHHPAVLRSHGQRTAADSAGYLLPRLNRNHRLLDVGCGPGSITVDLAGRVGRVTAIDITESVLEPARELAAERSVANVDFRVGDVYDQAFADDSFDVVHAHQVLQHLDDPVAALREMRRVCVPGGLVAARDADYAAMTWYPRIPELDEWLALYRGVARGNGGEPDAGRRLLGWARRAGFTEVTATASTWCYATPADRDRWGGGWAERIVGSAIAEQAVAGGHCTRGDLDRIAAGWWEWAAAADGWFAVLHGEIMATA